LWRRAGLLKDPAYMAELVKSVVNNVSIPVTVKTRLGMDGSNITILDVVRRLEDAGAKALTVHCRTRAQVTLVSPIGLGFQD